MFEINDIILHSILTYMTDREFMYISSTCITLRSRIERKMSHIWIERANSRLLPIIEEDNQTISYQNKQFITKYGNPSIGSINHINTVKWCKKIIFTPDISDRLIDNIMGEQQENKYINYGRGHTRSYGNTQHINLVRKKYNKPRYNKKMNNRIRVKKNKGSYG